MSSVALVCTVCGKHNILPFSANIQKRESMMTFCDRCSAVTLQRVDSRGGDESHKGITSFTTESMQTSADPYHRAPVVDSNDALWRRLQNSLANNDITMGEFQNCDAMTKARLATAIGFGSEEAQRIVDVAGTYDPRKILNASQIHEPLPAFPAVTPLKSSPSVAKMIIQEQPQPQPQRQQMQPLQQEQQVTASACRSDVPMQGFTMHEDGSVVAHCSVYPHLLAEFWCSLCGVLVSSRCHVTGVHKDHPFITLRQAAEAHVRDLKMWSERCRTQLNVVNSVVANLHHSKEVLDTTLKDQNEQLDKSYDEIVRGLTEWRNELRSSIHMQIEAQQRTVDLAIEKSSALIGYYALRLRNCEPLLSTIPPVHQVDKQAEDWSLRVMSLVSNLRSASIESIPMPRLTIPDVKSMATPATYMELLKAVSVPASVRVPDVLDTGYLNFPHPTHVARETFTLLLPEDAKARGILIYSGRTLTRSQDVTPMHSLVCASQVFYTGITAWEVHIDRLGSGPGRVLAGILMPGTDGEGVVWDGHRIVGPNEGECRVLSDRYTLQTGTTLRFLLELEAPSYFLIFYYENEVVARVPLPPSLSGWLPAFSVFGPQDQVTVVPTSTTAAEHLASEVSTTKDREKRGEEAKVSFLEHEQKLNALQQQLLAVNSRISQDQYERLINPPKSHNPVSIDQTPPVQQPRSGSNDYAARTTSSESQSPQPDVISGVVPSDSRPRGDNNGNEACRFPDYYSPELLNILSFVDSMK